MFRAINTEFAGSQLPSTSAPTPLLITRVCRLWPDPNLFFIVQSMAAAL
jgi:hypothetical protein